MEVQTGPAISWTGRTVGVDDLVGLLVTMPAAKRLAFARWCRDAAMPEAARQNPLGSPEESAAIEALEDGIEDLGGRLTPEIHVFFDPVYGEWPAWTSAKWAVAALARALASDASEIGDLAPVLEVLTNRP